MEIRTCEEFVIAELGKAQLEVELLDKENAELLREVGALKEELAKRDTPIERHIAAEGRKKTMNDVMYVRCTSAEGRDGEALSFEQWCLEAMGYYSKAREKEYGMGKEGFIRYFEPELRVEYEKRLAELSGDDAE